MLNEKIIVDLSYYAQNNIANYNIETYIPQENLEYLNSGLITTNMSCMFSQCSNILHIPKLNIDTSKCTDMSGIFSFCHSLISIDLSNFDTSNVNDMSIMFAFDEALHSIDLSNFNTSNATNMEGMFIGNTNLLSLDLSNFDTGNVTNMSSMFNLCINLEHIEGIIDMKSCKDASSYAWMFRGCDKLRGVKIKNPPEGFINKLDLNIDQYEIVK